MRIVADTNVLISALGWKGGNCYAILQKCFAKEISLVLSADIIMEFKRVALRPKFGFASEEIDEFISAILEIAIIVQPEETVQVIIDDLTDNKFLETAAAGNAQYIVTGDMHLLQHKEWNGIKMMKPSDFLKLFVL